MIEINLLPKELQIQGPRVSFSRGMLAPVAGVVVLATAMAGLTFYQKQQVADLDSKIGIAKARAEQLQRDIQMVDALVDIKGKITARIDAVKTLDQNRTTWVNALEDMTGRMPEYLWLTAMKETRAASTPAPGADSAGATQTVAQIVPAELEGYAYSLSSLANLIISLRNSGYFKQVDLSHAREVKLDSHPAYSFALSCQFDYSGIPNPGNSEDSGDNEHLALQSAPTQ